MFVLISGVGIPVLVASARASSLLAGLEDRTSEASLCAYISFLDRAQSDAACPPG